MINNRLRSAESRAWRSPWRDESGFTLIEILVVIAIIGLIMALVGPRVLNHLSDSKIKAAKVQIESLVNALDLMFLDTGRYPSPSEGLNALIERPANMRSWNGPYLRGTSLPNDPWGRQYVYRVSGRSSQFEIISYGSDGHEGGSGAGADITNRSQ